MPNEHSGHRDRLREQYLTEGLDNFPPHNVLELLLFYSVPRRDTNVLAHRLIEQFGSLVGVLNAAPEQLAQVEGIGMNAALHLHLVADIARRYYAEAISPPPNDAERSDLMRYYGKKLVAACNGLRSYFHRRSECCTASRSQNRRVGAAPSCTQHFAGTQPPAWDSHSFT